MMQNIILITLMILLIFFLSNETKINDIINKKYIKYLFILVIIYFVKQNYNFTLLIVALLVIIFLNVDIKGKIENNQYFESFSNNIKETFDFIPYKIGSDLIPDSVPDSVSDSVSDSDTDTKKSFVIEPFKKEVSNLKELYENIKIEIKKL